MLAKLASYTLIGIEAAPVEVEVDVSSAAMPKTLLVGLAETAVRESTDRPLTIGPILEVDYPSRRCP